MRWTAKARLKRSKQIGNWQPWLYARGPITHAGKRRSSLNRFSGSTRPLYAIAKRALKNKKSAISAVLNQCAGIEGYRQMLPTCWAKALLENAGFVFDSEDQLTALKTYQEFCLAVDFETALPMFDQHHGKRHNKKKIAALRQVHTWTNHFIMTNVKSSMMRETHKGNTSAAHLLVMIQQEVAEDLTRVPEGGDKLVINLRASEKKDDAE